MPRRRTLLIALALISALVIVVVCRGHREPTYAGRKVTAWQDEWAALKTGSCYEAWKHIGTNALPYAIHNLALNDSIWRTNYGRLQAKLPALLQRVFHKPKPLLKEVDGANLFSSIGSNSLPHALALLNHKSVTVRRSTAWGLGSIRRQTHSAKEAIPALTAALSDPDRMVRFDAALSLKEFGPDASNAVPALARVVACATNNDFYLRAVAATSLGKVGPAASNAVTPLQAGVHESLPYFRGVCAVAIWRITGDVDTALPVLLEAMPATVVDSKWDWIIALGEMGPRAKAAIPQLTTEMQQLQWQRQSWILEYVTNALRRIDPDAAAKVGILPEQK